MAAFNWKEWVDKIRQNMDWPPNQRSRQCLEGGPLRAEQDAAYIQSLTSDLGSQLEEIDQLNKTIMQLRKELSVACYNWRFASVAHERVRLEFEELKGR